jgi:uncharacterized protein YcaQ
LGCLQIDPIRVVEHPHYLIPWSRIGYYEHSELDKAIWEHKTLFHYWAHAASLVPTADYPIHQVMMRRYPAMYWSVGYERLMKFLEANKALKRHILSQLRKKGPLRTSDFQDLSVLDYKSTGWNTDRNVDRMLDYLWTKGQLMIVGRSGQQRVWDLAERWFPDWTPKNRLSLQQQTRQSIERSIKAMGLATKKHIWYYFTRWRYEDLPNALKEMTRKKTLIPATVDGLKGDWYVHPDDIDLIDRLRAGEWEPRSTLLSPFDPLIADRGRLKQLWDFEYGIEIYVPKHKRKFGYYILPILTGDQLIGRVDPTMDRKTKTLTINAVYREPTSSKSATTAKRVKKEIENLATWLGAEKIVYSKKLPPAWAPSLRA